MTPTPRSLLRPRDADALRATLRAVATEGDVPVLFGGEVHGDTLLLSEFVGTRTQNLRGLAVRSRSGLGGASMVAARPMSVADYRRAVTITHDYDRPVLSEGIRAVLAVPVLVDGRTRAMLYGAYRSSAPFSAQAADLMVDSARALGEELRIRDEVDRRMRLAEAQAPAGAHPIGVEQIREVHAGLRSLAADSPPALQGRLRDLAGQLASALAGETISTAAALTVRELDVLAEVALGCTNTEAAQRLSLKPETVKSYLRSAATKLGAHTRHEAVSKARRAGLLP